MTAPARKTEQLTIGGEIDRQVVPSPVPGVFYVLGAKVPRPPILMPPREKKSAKQEPAK